jgi:hypothetical protein
MTTGPSYRLKGGKSSEQRLFPLTGHLVEANARGDRDIEALHAPENGDVGGKITHFLGTVAQALFFSAHDNGDGSFEVDGIQGFCLSVKNGAHDPDPRLLKNLKRAPQISDGE